FTSAAPIPEDAPVTSAHLPPSSFFIAASLLMAPSQNILMRAGMVNINNPGSLMKRASTKEKKLERREAIIERARTWITDLSFEEIRLADLAGELGVV